MVSQCFKEVGEGMRLSDLMGYSDIVIQCHDNPDADAVGAGYGLYKFFESKGKKVRLIYGGESKVTKSNMIMLINEYNIPLEHVEEIDIKELLITVDCQYGAGNVTKFETPDVAIIDHHQPEIEGIEKTEIRSFLASACTVVWDMLRDEGFDVNEHDDIATSLYYGLYMDSGEFSEIDHPLDKDMQDNLKINSSLFTKLQNSVLTLSELEIAGMALIRHSYNKKNRFALVKAEECDPNILGYIADLALQVDSIDVCVIYNKIEKGIKFSIRSCVNEVKANELAGFLSKGIGGGGGHLNKAGGTIRKEKYNETYEHLNEDEYFLTRLTKYYQSFDVIHALKDHVSVDGMKTYKKKALPVGFVHLIDVVPNETPITIRTLEGDLDVVASEDTYAMIGIEGEVYPIKREKFESSYQILDEAYDAEFEYFPSIRHKGNGKVIDLQPYAKKCVSKGESFIYSKPLEKAVKVFTQWDPDTYMSGGPGDYLAVRQDDLKDVYIIEKNIFAKTYDEI